MSASIVALALVPPLALSRGMAYFQISDRQTLVGGLFTAVCVLGMLAAVYPEQCRIVFRNAQNSLPPENGRDAMQIRGHHPDCQNYSANRLKVGGRVVCAACSGLLLGAIIALAGTAAYFFGGLDAGAGSVWLLALGEACMLLGLMQIWFSGYAKALVNMLLVAGSFLVLLEADVLGGSLVTDFYVLALILFVLWLRISLSQWHNRRTCAACHMCF